MWYIPLRRRSAAALAKSGTFHSAASGFLLSLPVAFLVRSIHHRKGETLQQYALITIIGIVVLILTILYVIYSSLKTKDMMNNKLQRSNDEILELSQQLEEATNSKLTFITNISRELCIPLTLIAEPINSILKSQNITIKQRDTLLDIAQHNASILMR